MDGITCISVRLSEDKPEYGARAVNKMWTRIARGLSVRLSHVHGRRSALRHANGKHKTIFIVFLGENLNYP